MKANMLRQSFAIEMREISSRVPPLETILFRQDQSVFVSTLHKTEPSTLEACVPIRTEHAGGVRALNRRLFLYEFH
jgi:hypothetical protein